MMKRTTKLDLPRRRFLRGIGGAALALPTLEAFTIRRAAGAPVNKKIFTVFMAQANGAVQERFWPTTAGPLTTASMTADSTKAVYELRDHAAKLGIVRGVNYPFGNSVGCGHAAGCVQTLTASRPKGSSNRATPSSESADVRIGREVGMAPLTLYAGKKNGYLDDALSFEGAGTVKPGENNPWSAYGRFTGLTGMMTTAPTEVNKLVARRKSVNDLLRTELNELRARRELSTLDRQRLDAHFTSIRDLEMQMTGTVGPMTTSDLEPALRAINGTHTANDKMEEVVKLQLSLIALVFASDKARVATLQVGEGNDHTEYFINGQKAPKYHFISHRVLSDGADGTAITNAVELHHQIDRIHARYFKHLLDQLTAHKTADGRPLLDDSVAVWLNFNADGPPHGLTNVPHVYAGSGGGYLKTGLYVNAGGVDSNRFLNSVISASVRKADGAPVDDFGDATRQKGVLPAIVA
jgi:hypothetical protein